jgi:G2/mitotic-specific cyclin 1/2
MFIPSLTIFQARSLRTRATTNENDENGPSTRLTRAKAAALSAPEVQITQPAKNPLQTKKATSTTTTNNGPQRKRAALGDVSNVTKTENADAKDAKKATTKTGLTSKVTGHTGGVQKLSRTNTSRTALGTRDANSKKVAAPAPEPKRPGSGSGVMGSTQMKRTSSQKSVKEEASSHTEEPPRKKVDVEKAVKETATTIKEDVVAEAEEAKEQYVDVAQNLDEEDLDDPLMAAEYVVDIFDYLRDLELETLPNPDYIEHQPDLEWKMRGILVDWLIEVHTRFRLLPETLFLAVNIIDRFLSAEVVALDRLQLVGVTAMFIASKYEEVL